MDSKAINGLPSDKRIKIVFVLGGPGSGKGTQCAKIVEHFGFTHYSAGDLLRAECKSGSKYGELEKRLLSRNQGREDDNVETIKKRFKVFIESTLPVVTYYEQRGKVRKVNAAKPPEEIFKDIKAIFSSFQQV
ncbi:Uridylate kinase [Carex littledalei]|uniref:adenylate kinase n=1 Tax=Carex littledalei TaxID=544730 RepID=A0A833QDE6_9POAL|nr:Uridylate kinase [Carex littledalei]